MLILNIKLINATELIGHLHPLLVHLPIGIIVFAFVITILKRQLRESLEKALGLALLLGAITSLLACIAGYLLSQTGDYDEVLVQKHQWTGIATCILSILSYSIINYRRLLVWVTCLIMAIAGHLGGTLTHGEGYLLSSESKADHQNTIPPKQILVDSIDPIKMVESKNNDKTIFLYRDQVSPILQNKCYSCHSNIKRKGGLRLDNETFIRKGGKNGEIIKTENPDLSPLYTHLILPLEDDLHMPPKGKRQLTDQEISVLHYWIKKGAPFGEIIQSSESNPLTSILVNEQKNSVKENNASLVEPAEIKTPLKEIPAVAPIIIENLKKQELVISSLQDGFNGLSVNFVNIKNYNTEILEQLMNIKDQTIKLKLTNQPVQDGDLKNIGKFKNLTHLQLEKTAITDIGLGYIKEIGSLEQLNLYGTAITDKGIAMLSHCKNLKVLYLWETKTTQQGIAALQKSLPSVRIESGGFKFNVSDSTKKQRP